MRELGQLLPAQPRNAAQASVVRQADKKLHWIDGARHVDLYHKDEYVTPAIAELAGFFHTRLASTPRSDARPGGRTQPTPTPAQTAA
ncbi:hypothetical protein O3Q52_09225 [Streptomyces sp. ActVer]|uniref:hypothetical protein n=1 Tax=Streptomyces sp. ActVer TaxID=3014558 RepID=UPI0022B2DE45|nr:hypothetical protein [Streptomyces sp. ActVer]MCZ4508381.1 hypothetical protein [Streptomyces sp. ActVer]